jgi:porin
MSHTVLLASLTSALLSTGGNNANAGEGLLPVPDYSASQSQTLGQRTHLLGDWGGARQNLANEGVTVDLAFTQLAQSIVDGGADRENAYGGKLTTLINLDLDRMGAVPGALVTVKVESRYGESVNGASGALLPVSDTLYFPLTKPADEDLWATITQLDYTQFLSKELGVFVGKFTLLGQDLNEFAGGEGSTQFAGHPFTTASVTSLFNPYSTIGGGVLYMPSSNLTISSSLYASDDSSTTSGLDTLDDGLVWATAVQTQHRIDDLPGGARFTYQYAFDQSFTALDGRFITPTGITIPLEDDSWCAFANFWQYLTVDEPVKDKINLNDGKMDLRGVGAFLRVGFADEDTNPIEWTASAGLAAKGLVAGREDDTMGVGYAHSQVSGLPIQNVTGFFVNDTANRIEAYYDMALTPAAGLTFDVQFAESLLKRNDTATVLGLRLRLAF